MRRQQAAIAEFGGQALRSEDLDSLLNEAAVLVARGLGVSNAKVLTREPDGRFLVRAGFGWAPDVVGNAKLEADSQHLMFVGLKRPLKQGEKFAATLTFEKAGTISVEFAVEAMGGGHDHGG